MTTLLLNFVVLLFVQMMLEGPFKDPMGGGWPQSEPILPTPASAAPVRAHAAACGLLARRLLASVRSACLIDAHRLGLRDPRGRRQCARRALMPASGDARSWSTSACLSGALAGLAGASEVAGLKGYLTADISRGFGYAGIVVAMIAGLEPLVVVPAAIFVAGIFVGADTMSRTLRRVRTTSPT